MSNVDTRLCNVDVILNHIHTMETTCSLPRTAFEHRATNVETQGPSFSFEGIDDKFLDFNTTQSSAKRRIWHTSSAKASNARNSTSQIYEGTSLHFQSGWLCISFDSMLWTTPYTGKGFTRLKSTFLVFSHDKHRYVGEPIATYIGRNIPYAMHYHILRRK